MSYQETAKSVFELEAKALQQLGQKINSHFDGAVQAILNCSGRLVVCGMGKSGLIGKKIAATLASVGRPSFFLHPSEAIHGDLGMLMENDCFLSLSNSGETDELLQILPHIQALELPHICIVGRPKSTLARYADFVLDVGVSVEAARLQAVPLASSLTALAMGDALAAAYIEASNFQQADFLRYHPGGNLGKRLLTKVQEAMQSEKLPLVGPNTNMQELLLTISAGQLGLAIVQEAGKVLGIITDGDLRRQLSQTANDAFFALQAKALMTPTPKTISPQASLLDAEEQMQQLRINALLVLEEERLLGIIAKQHLK